MIQLNKLLAQQRLCSRREADKLLRLGLVKVDGELATVAQRVAPDARVELDSRGVAALGSKRSVLLHKPAGFLSQSHTPQPGQRFALDLCTWGNAAASERHRQGPPPARLRKMACAGRLDQESSGLLVFTQVTW
jgi:23S rRNA pseudouridine2604 synthase